MDLTKIDKPFGTLDIETKLALHRAHYEGKLIVRQHPDLKAITEVTIPKPEWFPEVIYRVAPPPQRDIQVPWHVFGPEVQWAARDEDGAVFLYGERPDKIGSEWIWGEGYLVRIDHLHLIGFDPGTKPWDQSLVRRPEGV